MFSPFWALLFALHILPWSVSPCRPQPAAQLVPPSGRQLMKEAFEGVGSEAPKIDPGFPPRASSLLCL